MRYDTPIYFQHRPEPIYDETTGNYTEGKLVETLRYASVVTTDRQIVSLIYGGTNVESKTVHLQNKYSGEYESIRIGDRTYKVDHVIPLRIKEGLVVSGTN